MEASMQRDLTCYAPIGGKLKTAEYQSFGEEWIIDRALDCQRFLVSYETRIKHIRSTVSFDLAQNVIT